MSWIGKKIYEYLKECEEFKKEMNAGYQQKDKLDTCNPPVPNIINHPHGYYVQSLPNFKFTPPAPERVPFENFKNNRKKMKKEVRHCERYILTSVKEDGKVSITIEPKKGYDVCNVSLNVGTGELPKEPVLPKELLNPRPELQDQYDTLAKLIATRDYYNAGSVFSNSDIVAVIIVDCVSQDIVGHGGDVRFGKTKSKLYFKNALTAEIVLNNFRTEIESVKHLI